MQLLGRIPNFDEPIDALEICHENILKRMDTLAALASIAAAGDVRALVDHADVWREVLAFIEHNVANHSHDEDDDLFPMLRGVLPAEIDALHHEHRQAEDIERTMMAEFARMSSAPADASAADVQALAERALALAALYRRHIARENDVIFPAARQHLSAQQLENLGNAMRSRRKLAALPHDAHD